MFNFLRKKETDENKNDDVISSITYYVNPNKEIMIDVHITDYDEESISALSYIIQALGSDNALVNTCEIIRDFFIKDGHSEDLVKLFTPIANKLKVAYSDNQDVANNPCIKPSEII